jgi:hypothetical protein
MGLFLEDAVTGIGLLYKLRVPEALKRSAILTMAKSRGIDTR